MSRAGVPLLLVLAAVIATVAAQSTCAAANTDTEFILSEPSGNLTDGSGANFYTNQIHCAWNITAPPTQRIYLTFEDLWTECGWDFVLVMDGPENSLVASYSGNFNVDEAVLPRIASSGPYMRVVFYTDTAVIGGGFSANYVMSECPWACSSHGSCNNTTGVCACDPGWIGDDCGLPSCPNNCTDVGVCVNGACQCPPGTLEPDCAAPYSAWQQLHGTSAGMAQVSVSQPRRASHTTTLCGGNVYLIGGFTHDIPTPTTGPADWSYVIYAYPGTFYSDVWRFNNAHGNWTQLPALADAAAPVNATGLPLGRRDHSTICRQDRYLIVYGGVNNVDTTPDASDNWGVLNDAWELDTQTGQWRKLAGLPKFSGGVPRRFAHNAHYLETEDVMLVFAGRQTNTVSTALPLRYTNTLYVYSFADASWCLLQPVTTAAPLIRYRSASVVTGAPGQRRMYVLGGASTNPGNPTLWFQRSYLSDVWVFLIDKLSWVQLRLDSGLNRNAQAWNQFPQTAGASATILGNAAYLFGGRDGDYDPRCQVDEIWRYDLSYNTWTRVSAARQDRWYASPTPRLMASMQRYPVDAGVDEADGFMVVGGHTGDFTADTWVFRPPNITDCAAFIQDRPITEELCVSNPHCGWCNATSSCVTVDPTTATALPGLCANVTVSPVTQIDPCLSATSCGDCLALDQQCGWCRGYSECRSMQSWSGFTGNATCPDDGGIEADSCDAECAAHTTCEECIQDAHCGFCSLLESYNTTQVNATSSACAYVRVTDPVAGMTAPWNLTCADTAWSHTQCPMPCHTLSDDCFQCLANEVPTQCVYCGDGPTPTCHAADNATYVAELQATCYRFHDGNTSSSTGLCPVNSCSDYASCSTCGADPLCGWCDESELCLPQDEAGDPDPALGAVCPAAHWFPGGGTLECPPPSCSTELTCDACEARSDRSCAWCAQTANLNTLPRSFTCFDASNAESVALCDRIDTTGTCQAAYEIVPEVQYLFQMQTDDWRHFTVHVPANTSVISVTVRTAAGPTHEVYINYDLDGLPPRTSQESRFTSLRTGEYDLPPDGSEVEDNYVLLRSQDTIGFEKSLYWQISVYAPPSGPGSFSQVQLLVKANASVIGLHLFANSAFVATMLVWSSVVCLFASAVGRYILDKTAPPVRDPSESDLRAYTSGNVLPFVVAEADDELFVPYDALAKSSKADAAAVAAAKSAESSSGKKNRASAAKDARSDDDDPGGGDDDDGAGVSSVGKRKKHRSKRRSSSASRSSSRSSGAGASPPDAVKLPSRSLPRT